MSENYFKISLVGEGWNIECGLGREGYAGQTDINHLMLRKWLDDNDCK